MAIAWIEGIENHYSSPLTIRCTDQVRRPTLGSENPITLQPDDTYQVPGLIDDPVRAQNLTMPWGPGQYVDFTWTRDGSTYTARMWVDHERGWDWAFVASGQTGNQVAKFAVGSMADAPGINYSYWTVGLSHSGKFGVRCKSYQGARTPGQAVTDALSDIGNIVGVFAEFM